MRLAATVAESWRDGGPAAVLRDMASLVLRPLHRQAERSFDRRHGVQTGMTALEAARAGDEPDTAVDRAPYQPITPAVFAAMRRVLPRDLSRYTFVDLGSGKGRALLLAATYGFHRIVGVEFDADLHAQAEANIAACRKDRLATRTIEVTCGDAAALPIPTGPLVIFLYNPFGEATLRQVMANLAAAYAAERRPIYLLYAGPYLTHLIEAEPFLRLRARRRFALYKGAIYASLEAD